MDERKMYFALIQNEGYPGCVPLIIRDLYNCRVNIGRLASCFLIQN